MVDPLIPEPIVVCGVGFVRARATHSSYTAFRAGVLNWMHCTVGSKATTFRASPVGGLTRDDEKLNCACHPFVIVGAYNDRRAPDPAACCDSICGRYRSSRDADCCGSMVLAGV